MDRLGRLATTLSGRVAAATAAALLAGCTMCPDPYDYSGPVPNGSSPQNDFRARSNGILPLGAAPCPWPPLVEGAAAKGGSRLAATPASRRRGEPTLADSPPDAGEPVEQAVGDVETTSVLVVIGEETAATEADSELELSIEPTAALEAVEQAAEEVAVPVPLADAEPKPQAAQPTPPPTAPEQPALAETPGWRPRQLR